MNRYELEILDQIETAVSQDDAAFAELIAIGPRLSASYKASLVAVVAVGLAVMMLFPIHLVFGVIGYAILVAAGTDVLRHRPLKPADESPLQFFHRLTAGLFANTGTVVEPSLD
jgi:hypothetical protein